MKRLLLDSQSLLWWLTDSPELGEEAKAQIADPINEIFVSAATVLDLSKKQSNGQLEAPAPIREIVDREEFSELPINFTHATESTYLPALISNETDRLLLAQAQTEGLTLLSASTEIRVYGISFISARA